MKPRSKANDVVQILRKAKTKIKDFDRWCVYAEIEDANRDRHYAQFYHRYKLANKQWSGIRCCAVGAVKVVRYRDSMEECVQCEAIRLLDMCTKQITKHDSVVALNDRRKYRSREAHRRVLAVFDLAIKKALEKETGCDC